MTSALRFAAAFGGWRRRMAVVAAPALLACGLFGAPSAAHATTITEYAWTSTGFALNAARAIGQSVTTPAGSSWDHLTFNFYDSSGAALAQTGVKLYLLSQAYTGTPSALSSATTGFIASATSNGSIWTFTTSVTLGPATQYFFYSDAIQGTSAFYNVTGAYAGGDRAVAQSAGQAYSTVTGQDHYFNLSGTAVNPGPVPGAGCLSWIVLGFGGLTAYRKRLLAQTALWLARARSFRRQSARA